MAIVKKVCSKFQAIYGMTRLRMNGLRGLPAQTGKEIAIFKAVFDHFADGKKIRVFEWGSGFSTIYYAGYLKDKNVEFEWHAIENNKSWYEKVQSMVEQKGFLTAVRLYLEEFTPFWEKPGWGPLPPKTGLFAPAADTEKNYVSFPLSIKDAFDVVIVDARFRRRCLQVARQVLSDRGVVILHDAQKTHYQQGISGFTYGEFFATGAWYPCQRVANRVWVGSMGNRAVFGALKQFDGERHASA